MAWLICGCTGAVLMDADEDAPVNYRNIALGPLGLALGIMVCTEPRS
jgi:hypothetical protein